MADRIQEALDEMDEWIADRSAADGAAPGVDAVVSWRDALAFARGRLNALAESSRLAVDSFLMRNDSTPSSKLHGPKNSRRIVQEHMRQLATAMAALERELAILRAMDLPETGSRSAGKPDS